MISLIIPVYRAEAYLPATLASVLAQTYTDWECILVDDGSPDSSGEICDRFAAEDARFRVIHQANGGVSAARNAGLAAASGEFAAFVDADDQLDPAYMERLSAAMTDGVDLVFCDFVRVDPAGEVLYSAAFAGKLSDLLAEHPASCIPCTDRSLAALWTAGALSTSCIKLYRRSILDHRFDSGLSYAEDSLFVSGAALKARSIAFVDAPLYRYLYREGSLSAGWWPGLLTQRSRSLTVIAERFAGEGYPQAAAAAREMRDSLNPEAFFAQLTDPRQQLALLKEYCALDNYPEMLAVVRATRSRLTGTVYRLRSPRLLRIFLKRMMQRRGEG